MSIPQISHYTLPIPEVLPENRVHWQVDKDRAVLLVHDMQEYFVRFFGDDNPLIQQLTKNISELLAWARRHQIPVVYTAQPSNQSPSERALLNDVWGPGLTGSDPALRSIVSPLAPRENDTVLVKWRYSAFQKSELESLLRRWQRDQLVIVGVYAHIGCLATALEAFMRDIQPFVVADGVADFSEQEHLWTLDYIAGRCGGVVSKAQLLGTRDSLSREELKAQLLALIDDDQDFDPDENLVDYGLDSVQVMSLIGQWQQRGLRFRFEELARNPTLNGWWALIEEKSAR